MNSNSLSSAIVEKVSACGTEVAPLRIMRLETLSLSPKRAIQVIGIIFGRL